MVRARARSVLEIEVAAQLLLHFGLDLDRDLERDELAARPQSLLCLAGISVRTCVLSLNNCE